MDGHKTALLFVNANDLNKVLLHRSGFLFSNDLSRNVSENNDNLTQYYVRRYKTINNLEICVPLDTKGTQVSRLFEFFVTPKRESKA